MLLPTKHLLNTAPFLGVFRTEASPAVLFPLRIADAILHKAKAVEEPIDDRKTEESPFWIDDQAGTEAGLRNGELQILGLRKFDW